MQRWREAGRDRRRAVFALAALAHVALVATMWHARLHGERRAEEHVVQATLLFPNVPAPRVSLTPAPVRPPARTLPPAPRVTRLRAPEREGAPVDARAIHAAPLEPQPIAQAASDAAPPASAASQPLNLTLSREQLRAIIAGSKPTLAQLLAAPPRPSAFARLGGDDAPYEEVPMAGGVTEVHVHGGCFRLVPTPRAQYDPFNHANERVTAACR
jgi:hypothetical protein